MTGQPSENGPCSHHHPLLIQTTVPNDTSSTKSQDPSARASRPAKAPDHVATSCATAAGSHPLGQARSAIPLRHWTHHLTPVVGLVADSTIVAMTDHGMAPTDAPSPKMIATLLREARSVSRRADKLGADVTAVQDPTIQQLAAEASGNIEQLVHHLMLLDQHAQRTRRGAGHRAP